MTKPWYDKWYKTKEWKQLRARQLNKHPMCQCQHCKGKGYEANVVDHIQPHRGNKRLFLDPNNIQSMNKHCHDKHKQSQEKGGKGFAGCSNTGQPLDDNHHWNMT